MFHPEAQRTYCRFTKEDVVRVREGVFDPDLEGLPLGGWTGIVSEVEESDVGFLCLVDWSIDTLDRANPIYEVLADRAGLDFTSMWLAESDLEQASGPSVPLATPPEDLVRCVRERDARIRAALGLAEDDGFPVGDESQFLSWHAYLKARLPLPFEAQFQDDTDDAPRDVTVVDLIRPEVDDDLDTGLWCDCREENRPLELPLLELEAKGGNQAAPQLISDFDYWHNTWWLPERAEEWAEQGSEEEDWDEEEPSEAFREQWEQAKQMALRMEIGDLPLPPGMFDDAGGSGVEPDDLPGMEAPLHRAAAKVGRNDPCPCGSGLKFKKCCLNRRSTP